MFLNFFQNEYLYSLLIFTFPLPPYIYHLETYKTPIKIKLRLTGYRYFKHFLISSIFCNIVMKKTKGQMMENYRETEIIGTEKQHLQLRIYRKTESNNNIVVDKVHQPQKQVTLVCYFFIEERKGPVENDRIRLTANPQRIPLQTNFRQAPLDSLYNWVLHF